MKKFLRNNGLSLVLLGIFLICLVLQTWTGFIEYNKEMIEKGGALCTISGYLFSGHFIQSTFENWESEFLQMAAFVYLSIFLYQKGSSESKNPEKKFEKVDTEPRTQLKNAPWPLRRGGIWLFLYKNSLSLAFALLFVISFLSHWYGSLKEYNHYQFLEDKPLESAWSYLCGSRFWYESFQNWQSEFLAIFCMVVFSIFLRQKGSPQSKPLSSRDSETEE